MKNVVSMAFTVLTYLLCAWHPLGGIGRRQRTSRELGRWLYFLSATSCIPSFFMSIWNSICQVFVGRPLFLFPWGFHIRACLVVFNIGLRRVCPIHRHLLCPISSLAGVCFVLVHRSSFEILSGQWIFRIFLMHPFMKVCTLLVVEFDRFRLGKWLVMVRSVKINVWC